MAINLQDVYEILDRALGTTDPAPEQAQDNEEDARETLERLVNAFRGRLVLLTQRFARGEIGLSEWRMLVELEIRIHHMLAIIIAVGGAKNLRRRHALSYQILVAEQIEFLNRWQSSLIPPTGTRGGDVGDVASSAFSERQLAARAGLYAGALRDTFEQYYAASIGLPPLPFYPADRTQCHNNCKCRWQYVKLDGNGDWDCYWRRAAEDSCPTCIARERACFPLRVRGGIVQPFNDAGTIY